MKITTEGFKLTIDLGDMVEALSQDDRVKLARLVAADRQLFAAVLECVASDSRQGNYFADADEGAWWFDAATLLSLREKLLPLMPEIARGAVTEALRQRNDARQKESTTVSWAWAMYHRWPESYWSARPATPHGWTPPPEPEPAEVDALMAGQKGSAER